MVDTTSARYSKSPVSDLTTEAGAPEIEVTPAMIEAAWWTLYFFDSEYGDVEDCLCKIYLAMERERRAETRDV